MNRAIADLYEPGSVFKIVTLSAAIDQGLTNPDEVVDCQMGAIYIAGHRIRDHKPFGLLTVSQILAKSSDVGAIKIGLRLGAPKFYDYIRSYGFGSLTDVDLPGENRGLLRHVENWTPVSVGSISMGQEVGVTPLQMVNAVSAIANGGLLYRPHVVRALRTGAGNLIPENEPDPKRVVRETTAATMRSMLEGVVLTAPASSLASMVTPRPARPARRRKSIPPRAAIPPTQLIASFVGFAPVNNPALTILVQLDSPSMGSHMGGAVAAPVFKRVAEQALAYLNVPQDEAIPPKTLRASRAAASEAAPSDVADFDPVQIESPDAQELDAEPAPPAPPAASASTSPPTVELAEGDGVQLPSLAGKTVRQVTEICQKLGVNPVLVGTGVAQQQQPEAGAVTRRGGSVTVWFGRPPEVAQARTVRRPRGEPAPPMDGIMRVLTSRRENREKLSRPDGRPILDM